MKRISRPLLVLLAVTLGMTAWALLAGENEAGAVVAVTQPRAETGSKPARADSDARSGDTRRTLAPFANNPFLTVQTDDTTAAPPPAEIPAPTVVAPPPPPPPPPFRYLGSLKENGRVLYFMADQERVYPTEIGKNITSEYQLTQVDSSGAQVTYLPLNQTQTLPLEQ